MSPCKLVSSERVSFRKLRRKCSSAYGNVLSSSEGKENGESINWLIFMWSASKMRVFGRLVKKWSLGHFT